jgi:fibro-slime domain-containing protein
VCGSGTETCTDDAWGPCNAPLPGPPTLQATVRNVYVGQPDFRVACCNGGVDPGIVATTLGADNEPVYAGNPTTGTLTTTGASDFYEWYHDVPGDNLSTTISLVFVPVPGQPGINQYDNEEFFPIDNQLFGNQGAPHNENITLETHTQVLYVGGESYNFASDDDLWVFINRTLAVDLGGIHARLAATIALDDLASTLGITVGQTYPMDAFYANRQPSGAVLMMAIPQSDLWSCP